MKRPLIICIVTGGIFLTTFVLYLAWYHQVTSLSATAEELTQEITTRSKAQLRIAAARSEISGLTGEEASVGSYFVAQANIVPFLEDLQARGASVGATVRVLSVAAGTGATAPTTVMLSVSGTFDHTIRALGAIEYAPYDLIVSSLALSGQKGAWQANMTLLVGSAGASADTPTATLPPLPKLTATSSARTGTTTTASPSL